MADDILLGRQPILNDRLELVGYELLFRDAANLLRAQVDDQAQATATVIANAFSQFGMASALGSFRGFINVDKTFLFDDVIRLLPSDRVVIEVLEHGEITPEVVERCRVLKAAGYTVALDDFVHLSPEARDILDVVSIVKVDLAQMESDEQLTALAAELRKLPATLLAEKVETREQFERCHALGFKLFQGYFFARPTVVVGRRLSHTHATVIRLLNMLGDDAEDREIESLCKQEPALTLSLLRLTNSVAMGARTPIASIRAAITMLGRQQLRRWLQLLLYAGGGEGGQRNPLLVMAATRGRFMELMAEHLHPKKRGLADLAFMTGIMSLMPAIFSAPIEEILAELRVADDVRNALLSRGGDAGDLLALAEIGEGEPGDLAALMARLPELRIEHINACTAKALEWSGQLCT